MVHSGDLVASVADRVAQVEMSRRTLRWDGRPVEPPPDLPALTFLARTAFPTSVLERRARFLRLMGWYPVTPPKIEPGGDSPLPPEATIEDHLALLYGGVIPAGREGDAGRPRPAPHSGCFGQAEAALLWALRGEGSPPTDSELAALKEFFDRQADLVDPNWRRQRPRDFLATTVWARLEAATLYGDRFFGRKQANRAWGAVSAAIWRLAEQKRRWFG